MRQQLSVTNDNRDCASPPVQAGEQSGVVERVVADLLAGHPCLLLGPDAIGKTLLLRRIRDTLNAEGRAGVATVLCDLADYSSSRSWPEAVQGLFCFISHALSVEGREADNADESLAAALSTILQRRSDIERLLVLFDHVDRLPADYMRHFAYECSALLNGPDWPLDRTVILWCGDPRKLRDPVANTNILPRVSRSHTVTGYTRRETDDLIRRLTDHLPISDADLDAIWQITGGHPSLICPEEAESYLHRVVERFRQRRLLQPTLREIAREEEKRYVKELLAAAETLHPWDVVVRRWHLEERSVRIADALVSRISGDGRILDLLMAVLVHADPQADYREFQEDVRDNHDLFFWDVRSQRPAIRGRIFERFLRRCFTSERIGWSYLLLEDKPDSFGKGILCYANWRGATKDDTGRAGRYSASKAACLWLFRVLSARFQQIDDPDEIIKSLLLVVGNVFGGRRALVLQFHDGDARSVYDRRNLAGRKLHGPDEQEVASSFAVRETLRTWQSCSQDGGNKIALPITMSRDGSGFVLWIDDVHQARLPDISILESLARAVEGPLIRALDRQSFQRELQVRERQVRLLSGVEPIASEFTTPLNDVATRAIQLLEELGFDARICLDSPLFGETRLWPPHGKNDLPRQSHEGPAGTTAEDAAMEVVAQSQIDWLPLVLKDRHLGVLTLTARNGRAERVIPASLREHMASLLSAALFSAWEHGRGQVHRFILDNVPVGIQVLDPEYHIVELNAFLENLLRVRDLFRDDWHGKLCWQVHRQRGQPEQDPASTAREAVTQQRPVRRIETWEHRELGPKKHLWHTVVSRHLPGPGGKPLGIVELSRPLYVGEVFEHLSEKYGLFAEKDPQRVKYLVAHGALMLGFDRCRLYWQDPGSGLFVSSAWAGFGYDNRPDEFRKLGYCLGPHLRKHEDTFELICAGQPLLLRRAGSADAPEVHAATVLFKPDFPFEDALAASDVQEVAMVPLRAAHGILGSLAVDYKFLGPHGFRFRDEDIVTLQQYGQLAASVIHSSEMHRSLATMINEVVHTLKVPVSLMQASAELLHELVPSSQWAAELHERIQHQASRAARLVQNMMAIPWAHQDGRRREWRRLELRGLLAEWCRDFQSLARLRQVHMDFASDSTEAPIFGDPDRLMWAIQNLMMNALDATVGCPAPASGHAVTVEMTALPTELHIRVRDTGRGIPRTNWERVWLPFFSTKKGDGLGLAATKSIIEAHDGTIRIEESVSQEELMDRASTRSGTCLLIVIPKAQPPATS